MTTDVEKTVYSTLGRYSSAANLLSKQSPTTLLSDLQLDSLTVLEVVYELEDHFSITLDASELRSLTSVGDLFLAVDTRLANAA